MSNYVCSDIHGCADEFFKLLDIIKFSENDKLYIIGDIFDRGPEPLRIYDYIKEKNNIVFIKGNHEKFFIDLCESEDDESIRRIYEIWMRNGGATTLRALEDKDDKYIYELYSYMKDSPHIVKVGDFMLVHAGLELKDGYKEKSIEEIMKEQSEEIVLWDRSFIEGAKYIEGITVIVGHTPTIVVQAGKSDMIHEKGRILIDCGIVFGGKLGCLRLDDMNEFYIESFSKVKAMF